MNSVNVLLTEIALNLLGNSFYDINGEPVNDLQSLYETERRTSDSNRPNLAEILGIFGSEIAPSTASSSAASATSESIDKDVITLEDDDDGDEFLFSYEHASEDSPKVANEPVQSTSPVTATVPTPSPKTATAPPPRKATATTSTATVPPPNKSFVAKPIKVPAPQSSTAPESSANANSDSDLEEIECEEYQSVDSSVRLNYIAKQTNKEFKRMKSRVRKQKLIYENGNRNLITLLKLKPKDVWNRFFDQQRQELIVESNVLMQFIRVIKNSDSINQKVLSKVAKDILAAKDTVP